MVFTYTGRFDEAEEALGASLAIAAADGKLYEQTRVLSVLAMSLGTAITVSALATLAVTAKNWAVYFAGDGRMGNRIHSIVEIGGAAFVFLFGLLLLSASLTGSV